MWMPNWLGNGWHQWYAPSVAVGFLAGLLVAGVWAVLAVLWLTRRKL